MLSVCIFLISNKKQAIILSVRNKIEQYYWAWAPYIWIRMNKKKYEINYFVIKNCNSFLIINPEDRRIWSKKKRARLKIRGIREICKISVIKIIITVNVSSAHRIKNAVRLMKLVQINWIVRLNIFFKSINNILQTNERQSK